MEPPVSGIPCYLEWLCLCGSLFSTDVGVGGGFSGNDVTLECTELF